MRLFLGFRWIVFVMVVIPLFLVGGITAIVHGIGSMGAKSTCTVAQQNVAGLPWKQVGGHWRKVAHRVLEPNVRHYVTRTLHSASTRTYRGRTHTTVSTHQRLVQVAAYRVHYVWTRVGAHWINHPACHTHNTGGNEASNFIAVILVIVLVIAVFLVARKLRRKAVRMSGNGKRY